MATTTNYGWTTPDDTALVKDGASAIRSLGTSVDTTTKNLNPSTTLGDIEYRSSTANTNTRLGIGSTGNVLTVAGGVPTWAAPASSSTFVGCSLYKTAVQSVSNDANTVITWDAEYFDTDGFHDNATNNSRITIPSGKGGKYLITGQMSFSANSTEQRIARILKNGTATGIVSAQRASNSPDSTAASVSWLINLVATDYIEFNVYQDSGSTLDFKTDVQFNAIYLGA